MKCGFLNNHRTADKRNAESVIFTGAITLQPLIKGALQLRPNMDERSGDRAPAYVVYHRPTVDGQWQEQGAAWVKQRNDESGEFLSITLDFPTWDAPLNLSAFPGDAADESWSIVWRRKRGGNQDE